MQAAGMLRDTGAIYCLLLLAPLIPYTYSHPLQFLPSIPGYIPVYIRNGDQPLEEINPALAEAFHETSSLSKNIRLDHSSPSHDTFDYDKINSVIDSGEKEYYPKLTKSQEKSNSDKQQKEEREEEGGVIEYSKKEENSDIAAPPTKIVFQLYGNDNSENSKSKKEAEKKVMPDAKQKATLISKESTIKLTRIFPKKEKESSKEESESNHPQLPSQLGHRDSSEDFVSVINVESFTDSPNVVRLYKDIEHSSGKQEVANEPEQQEDEETPVVKVQHPLKLLSDVQKLPPIPLPETEDNATEEWQKSSTQSSTEISSTELPAVYHIKDLSHLLDPSDASESSATSETIVEKTSVNESSSSNVEKILPIALTDAYEPPNQTKKTETVELPSEMATILYKDLSHLSDDDQSTSRNTNEEKEVVEEENDEEPPMKVASFLDVPSNVDKIAPDIQDDKNKKTKEEEEKDSISSSIVTEQVESKQVDDDQKKNLTERNDDVST